MATFSDIKVGDTVRIIGKSRHNGKTGVVQAIVPDRAQPLTVRLGRYVYFFSYQEVVKV